jgi:hypothetical protein
MFVYNQLDEKKKKAISILVKPIVKLVFKGKEVGRTNLTIVENTIEMIQCRILSNPLIDGDIQWFKNDRLIRGRSDNSIVWKGDE